MKLLSINIGQPRDIPFGDRIVRTAIIKSPIESTEVDVTHLGIEGDTQVDQKHHGGTYQAVYGYFEETKLPYIREGDPVDMQLMSGEHLKGHVESIARGIYDRDNPESRELTADVNPTFNWVRLAQRVPVRVLIDEVPDGVLLSAGITCTVIVKPQGRDDQASAAQAPGRAG